MKGSFIKNNYLSSFNKKKKIKYEKPDNQNNNMNKTYKLSFQNEYLNKKGILDRPSTAGYKNIRPKSSWIYSQTDNQNRNNITIHNDNQSSFLQINNYRNNRNTEYFTIKNRDTNLFQSNVSNFNKNSNSMINLIKGQKIIAKRYQKNQFKKSNKNQQSQRDNKSFTQEFKQNYQNDQNMNKNQQKCNRNVTIFSRKNTLPNNKYFINNHHKKINKNQDEFSVFSYFQKTYLKQKQNTQVSSIKNHKKPYKFFINNNKQKSLNKFSQSQNIFNELQSRIKPQQRRIHPRSAFNHKRNENMNEKQQNKNELTLNKIQECIENDVQLMIRRLNVQ